MITSRIRKNISMDLMMLMTILIIVALTGIMRTLIQKDGLMRVIIKIMIGLPHSIKNLYQNLKTMIL